MEQADNPEAPSRSSAAKIAAAVGALVVLALIAIAVVLSVTGGDEPAPAQDTGHPDYPAGQACVECHPDPHPGTLYGGAACDSCHGLNSWRVVHYEHPLNATDVDIAEMDLGIHAVIGCERCHPVVTVETTVNVSGSIVSTTGVGGRKPAPDPRCQTCHKPVHGGSTNCSTCHTPISWRTTRPLPRGHWPLVGMHQNVSCLGCHIRADKPSTRCNSCHPSPHGPSVTNCERCHSPIGWRVVRFNHASTGFALNRAHQALQCQACHTRGFTRAASCTQCHRSPHGPGFSDCSRCHTTSFDAAAAFNHSRTGFPLTGAHTRLACSRCHVGLNFSKPTSGACTNCHRNPHGAGFSTCTRCHNTTSFRQVSFNHLAATGFGITGLHTRLSCSSCHPGLAFASVRACTSCHGTPHGTPWRVCYSCHAKADVRRIGFNHTTGGHYVLASPHNTFACTTCHAVSSEGLSQFSSLKPAACAQCHTSPHGPGYNTCNGCHSTTAFKPAVPIQHPATVPLIGGHATIPCLACHTVSVTSPKGPVFVPPPASACAACHTSPHGGPANCADCHNPTGWENVTFVHPDISFHTGSAAVINETCSNCHPGNNFGTFTCSPCHQGMTFPPAARRR